MQQLEMLETTDKRRCSVCKEIKEKEAFALCRTNGRQTTRKECHSRYNKEHYRKKKKVFKERDRNYSKNKGKAKSAVGLAIKKGKLTRQPCEKCGAEKTDAHHDDYAKPLEVRWLCRSHHIQWHVDNGEALNAFTVKHWTPPKEAQK